MWGWQNLWLESDSSSVISCFTFGSFSPPWSLQTRWNNCILRLQNMVFHCSHTFREGNVVADKLANLGLLSSSLVWHSAHPIDDSSSSALRFLGHDNLQVCLPFLMCDFLFLPNLFGFLFSFCNLSCRFLPFKVYRGAGPAQAQCRQGDRPGPKIIEGTKIIRVVYLYMFL